MRREARVGTELLRRLDWAAWGYLFTVSNEKATDFLMGRGEGGCENGCLRVKTFTPRGLTTFLCSRPRREKEAKSNFRVRGGRAGDARSGV